MIAETHKLTWTQRALAALFLLALSLRVALPVGTMPVASAQGLSIVLCTGQGVMTGWVDSDGKLHKGKPNDTKADHPCAFSGLSAVVDVPSPDFLAAIHFIAAIGSLAARLIPIAIGLGLAAPPPPATGPPATL